jgi:hypothetical protein
VSLVVGLDLVEQRDRQVQTWIDVIDLPDISEHALLLDQVQRCVVRVDTPDGAVLQRGRLREIVVPVV